MRTDPTAMSRVSSRMTRTVGAVLLCVVVAFGAACGGNKKESTTPKAGGGSGSGTADPTSMKDGTDPGMGSGGVATNPSNPGTPTNPTNPNTNTPPPDPSGPPVVPINLDPDPSQAKSEVDRHLGIAKSALSQTPPDADAALREAKQALTVDATNVDAAAMVGFAYYHKKLYDTSELVLDDVFKRAAAKQNPNIYYVYGLVYDATNRPEQANLAFQTAVKLKPDFTSALVNLGAHQLMNKQYSEAVETFEKVTKQLNRTDATTLTSLGSAYRGKSGELSAGDSQRDKLISAAESSYKKAIQIDPGFGAAYYNLGILYLDADPYPGVANAIDRVNTAKGYFDQYKNMKDVDMKLYDERMKDVTKLLKRLQKKQAKKP